MEKTRGASVSGFDGRLRDIKAFEARVPILSDELNSPRRRESA